ncbi:glucans biosynthesis glucosyltransferase MdoH [uncultured Methylibium sp.]|uniref:glucans biosynthesis glucosyltransferase MdoH n=1 Tax=uncultured Methylibium sp. TaxID=381093 RepID=UPI0026006FB7|nr:glucans biosynthesis glucosyltransferase MdoH [uncultured Methylibium sp.]
MPPSLRLTAPPMRRGSMLASPWWGWRGVFGPRATPLDAAPWVAAATRRRRLLLALVAGSAALATWVLESAAPSAGNGWTALQTGLFALLFAWVAAGCTTAVMGYLGLRRGDRHALSAEAVAGRPIDAAARTAIVMPICNEDVATVAAGLRATVESLQQAGAPGGIFDVFLLSDTPDAALREAEVSAWQRLRTELGDDTGGVRIFYRWRRRRGGKKAGNVADFCRRWGRSYRYMVVLDADSVMSGEALLALVRVMEAHPRVGILQTAPRAWGLDSLHARLQQFSGRLTGPLFSAGLRYWQLGESHYWGHNAILRIEPFMRHCALSTLPGRGGLSGTILSHDFVEAALMRRAGYEVWLLPELDGSYEQAPPHLVEELQRDRRWCQGNLQNARLVAEPGLAGVHRAMFVTGAMSYAASPLWLAFVLIGALPWLLPAAGTAPPAGPPLAAIALWGATLAMLFVPRVLAVRLVLLRRQQAGYGGGRRLMASALLEALLSALQAPVRMLAHSVFVLGALTGIKLGWQSPAREAQSVGWVDAARQFGVGALLSAGLLAWWLAGQPDDAWRVLPLLLPLVVAVPLTVLTSRSSLGAAWRRRGWLLTPEEVQAPPVLQAARRHERRPAAVAPVIAPRPAVARAPQRRPSGMAIGWPRPALAMAAFSMAVGLSTLPRPVAQGALSASDLAAIRIVMMASSPSASPQVVEPAPLRMKRVSIGRREPARRGPTSI